VVDQETDLCGLNDQLAMLNESLARLGQPYKLAVVPLERLRLLDKNARFMPHEMFQNLVSNVQRDGALSSVPFCWFDGEVYHVLSGNHRVKAAREAQLTSILILYDDRPMSRQEFVARQLSHNAISGQDDQAVLRELWKEIEDVELKYYAGLDDKTLDQLADAAAGSLAEARLDFKMVTFLFLPEEVDRLREAFQKAAETVVADDAFAARLEDFGRTLEALDKAKASFDIRNAATRPAARPGRVREPPGRPGEGLAEGEWRAEAQGEGAHRQRAGYRQDSCGGSLEAQAGCGAGPDGRKDRGE
jgi:hypothetical protein